MCGFNLQCNDNGDKQPFISLALFKIILSETIWASFSEKIKCIDVGDRGRMKKFSLLYTTRHGQFLGSHERAKLKIRVTLNEEAGSGPKVN